MKSLLGLICATALIISTFGMAGAATYDFQPTPVDLNDLNHWKYYTWGIDWDVPAGETIVGASLFFDNIEDWRVEYNVLYVHLLDSATAGTTSGYDYLPGDQFKDLGILIYEGHLPNWPQDITIDFTADELSTLVSYLVDGNFGFGFDPDCHYYNDGITFTIETVPTHETPLPAAVWLFGSGLVGLIGLRRKMKN